MQLYAPWTPMRSKNGCLTCRRHKVKCDEQRPLCATCKRIGRVCEWPSTQIPPQRRPVGTAPLAEPDTVNTNPVFLPPPAQCADRFEDGPWHQRPIDAADHQPLDYANSTWGGGGTTSTPGCFSPGQSSQLSGPSTDTEWMDSSTTMVDRLTETSTGPVSYLPSDSNPQNELHHYVERLSHTPPPLPRVQESSPPFPHEDNLLNYFVRSIVPPILAEDPQKQWSSMRDSIMSMANSSVMVKFAVLAFSGLVYCRRQAPWLSSPTHYYCTALEELLSSSEVESAIPVGIRQHVLTATFFLCYVDMLEDRTESAHSHLRRAHKISRAGKSHEFEPFEIRILSWIRLLDAQTVSVGGDGLFLSDDDENIIAQPSPSSSTNDARHSEQVVPEIKELDVEDAVFQTLYHPGVIFFERVQSLTGRISKINPCDCYRDSVQDETEVMHIARQISSELEDLYHQRPILMDHAVKGSLTPPLICTRLGAAIARAFRTYLSNYYASKIHLHRVAYKDLPLSSESAEALSQIRELTRLLVSDLEPGDALPVSQLWPLLMLGSEERDYSEREWIRSQILQMEKVATNARATAYVLQEVQARQDERRMRVNIQSVMHEVFDSCFAII